MSLENIIHRIASDPDFAHAIKEDAVATLEANGIELNREELDALKSALSTTTDNDNIMRSTEQPEGWFRSQFKEVANQPT